ncbi:MAG: caspase family protein, partial [SAR324 cluster bacterium]|nr:caspase family protein [SAR324 cluster bacterium]
MKRLFLPFPIFLLLGVLLAGPSMAQTSPPRQGDRAVRVEERKPANAERRIALVIGNFSYKNIAALRNPGNDARDMAAALRATGFEVTLLLNASRAGMGRAIGAFEDAMGRGGVGLFFFAGHGVQVGGVNYLIPIGANITRQSEVEYEAISANRVLSSMEAAGNRLNMVFLDACRNNPFKGSRFRAIGGGLAAVRNAPRGSLISYATGAGEVAADGRGRNGIYTKNLLRHIRTPGLELTTMMKRVRGGVQRDTKNRQTPYELSSLTGDFYFAGARAPSAAPQIARVDPGVPQGPGRARVELGDIAEAARKQKASRRDWAGWLAGMKRTYAKVNGYDRDDITPDLKITAWRRFLAAYRENDPYSREDEAMRARGVERTRYWQAALQRLAAAQRKPGTAAPAGKTFTGPVTVEVPRNLRPGPRKAQTLLRAAGLFRQRGRMDNALVRYLRAAKGYPGTREGYAGHLEWLLLTLKKAGVTEAFERELKAFSKRYPNAISIPTLRQRSAELLLLRGEKAAKAFRFQAAEADY